MDPDRLRKDLDLDEALNRLLNAEGRKMGVVLLDQSIIAGIGSIVRNEILFI